MDKLTEKQKATSEQVQALWTITSITAHYVTGICYDVFDAIQESKYNTFQVKRANNILEAKIIELSNVYKNIWNNKSQSAMYTDASIALWKLLDESEAKVNETFKAFLEDAGCTELELTTKLYTIYFLIKSCQTFLKDDVAKYKKILPATNKYGCTIWKAYDMLETLQKCVANINSKMSSFVKYSKCPEPPDLASLAKNVIGILQSEDIWLKVLK